MLESFLSAIPVAASSPLALSAYAIAAGVWALMAWRTARNKALLANLQKLPSKDRLAALKAEMGHVELKEGLSPEQYLKGRMQSYLLIAFAITVVAVIVVLAMAALKKPSDPEVDLTLYQGPTLDDRMAEAESENDVPPRTTLHYEYGREGARLVVTPDMPYLRELASGDYVKGVNTAVEVFRTPFPELSFKIANNTGRTLNLNEIVVTVKSSTLDKSPLLYFDDEMNVGKFTLYNAGWGGVKQPKLKLNVGFSCNASTPPQLAVPIAGFDEQADVAVEPLVPADMVEAAYGCGNEVIGVCKTDSECAYFQQPVDCLETAGKDHCAMIPSEAMDEAEQLHAQLGSPQGAYLKRQCTPKPVCVAGDLDYRTEGGAPGRFRFQVPVYLTFDGGLGAPSPPSYRYHLMLAAGQSGVTRRIAIAQAVKPGDTDHFLLKIGTDKSALYDIELTLMGNDDKALATFPVRLGLLFPRGAAENLARAPLKLGDQRAE